MMRRETTYRLAGRDHRHEDILGSAVRVQELVFTALPEGQRDQAVAVLAALPGLTITPGREPTRIELKYDLAHYTLRGITSYLEDRGYHLDASLLSKLKRALAYFCEETMARNATAPQRLIKQSNQVYVKAYEYHPHGDHDDTPVELRDFK